jgi:hypothetical protein
MAKTYVVNEPPVSPMMFDYGAGFAKFIRRFEPAAGLPFLYDVACIERAWVEAYHASEACPVDASAFCNVQSGELPYLRIELHPSLRLVQSRFPALTIWQMNVAGGTLANVSLDDGAENSLVVRPHTDVEVRSVSNSGAAFVLALARGLCLAESIEEALEIDQGFDLTAALAGLMEAGAFVSFDVSLNVSRDGTSPTSSINAIGSA